MVGFIIGGYGKNFNTGYVQSFQFYNGQWTQVAQDIIGSNAGDIGLPLDTDNSGSKIVIGKTSTMMHIQLQARQFS